MAFARNHSFQEKKVISQLFRDITWIHRDNFSNLDSGMAIGGKEAEIFKGAP
jgi:hypothetical protein